MAEPIQASSTDDEIVRAFELAPVGLCVTKNRVIQCCNAAFAEIFDFTTEQLRGRSVECLYPTRSEFENIGERGRPLMGASGRYSDERIMRRRDGQLFWCHVSGRSLDRADPFAYAVWMFEDISTRRPVTTAFTPREREIVQLLAAGKTSKQIARALGVSPRTIEGHRGRLMRKLSAATPAEMIARLVGLR